MLNKYFQKYRGIFISTTLFMLFFLAYLVLNYFIQSSAIQEVRYANVLSTLQQKIAGSLQVEESINALKQLRSGGIFNFIDDADEAKTQWPAIANYLAPEQPKIDAVLRDLEIGNSLAANGSMATLVKQVVKKKNKKVKLVKTLQIAAGILTFLLYLMVIMQLVLKLSKTDEVEIESRKETEGILDTVSEGLFLLGNDHEIGVEQSASLKEMFKSEKDLEGNFFDFIGQYVPQSTVQIAKDYMQLLFGARVKEKLVEELNPLHQVEINIMRRDGSYESRYLDFQFKRVLIDGQLSHLLGSVTDVTKQVKLEQELVETKEEQEAQLDLLMSILHVDNAQLRMFFKNADVSLTMINKILESSTQGTSDIRTKLKEILRTIHQLKGDSAALGLHKFEFSIHALEEEIAKVQTENEKITGKELIPAVTRLKNLFSELSNMRSLVEKFANAFSDRNSAQGALNGVAINDSQGGMKDNDISENKVLFSTLNNLVETVAQRNDKRINFTSYGINDDDIPESLTETVNNIAVQLLRNSIVHGAELPQERVAQGKTDFVNLVTSFITTENEHQLIVRDDGRGIDWDEVIQRAVELGFVNQEKASQMNSNTAVNLLFKPGFSSKQDADLDGGRGVGLDVVYELVKGKDGKVSVQSQKGKFCQFKLTFPKVA